jgi:hypothetical protein
MRHFWTPEEILEARYKKLEPFEGSCILNAMEEYAKSTAFRFVEYLHQKGVIATGHPDYPFKKNKRFYTKDAIFELFKEFEKKLNNAASI